MTTFVLTTPLVGLLCFISLLVGYWLGCYVVPALNDRRCRQRRER